MITSPGFRLGRRMSAAELCDRCGTRASVLALLHSGGKLLFCGEHARMHHPELARIAECFEDPTARLHVLAA